MFRVAVLLTGLVATVVASKQDEEFMAMLKKAAAAAKTAPPENRKQLQEMLLTFEKEKGVDLKTLLPKHEWNAIFLEPGDYEEEAEGEEDEDEEDPEEREEREREAARKEEAREDVRAFLATHKPSMLRKLPALLSKWDGKEEQLLKELKAKYAPEE